MWAASPLRALPDPVSACCCVLRGWCMESIWPRLPWWLASRWVQPLGEALADVMMAGGDTRQGLSLLLSSWLGTVSRGSCILPWPQCLGDTCAPWPLVPETGRSCYPQSLGPRHLSSLLTPAHNSTGLPSIDSICLNYLGWLPVPWLMHSWSQVAPEKILRQRLSASWFGNYTGRK